MDCIHLSEIRCYGFTGALPEEQVLGQWFEVDLTLWIDLSKPGQSDNLDDTIDYGSVAMVVQKLVKTAKFALLERLATVIAEKILRSFPVHQVRVRLTKVSAPIPNYTGKVAVEIMRGRG
ncbi:MAG: dihydroneopterin aldolase [Leptolyngbyaceae cyanobacterium bins.59]|nr:dihydroneopterin aldolase [Leptolyngbyaceae cyanobacterium bins.59]